MWPSEHHGYQDIVKSYSSISSSTCSYLDSSSCQSSDDYPAAAAASLPSADDWQQIDSEMVYNRQKSLTHIPVSKQRPDNEELCLICGDRASGYHYNALSCEGCKGNIACF